LHALLALAGGALFLGNAISRIGGGLGSVWVTTTAAQQALHVVATAVLAVLALVARGRPRPLSTILALDLTGVLMSLPVVAFIVSQNPLGAHGEALAVAPFLLVTLLRAALLPVGRAWITLTSALGAAAVVAGMGLSVGATEVMRFDHAATVATAIWGALGVLASVVVSTVVHDRRHDLPTRLGNWVLEEELARGGMGTVFRARHSHIERVAAVKVLKAGPADRSSVQRFEREALLASKLSHPNVVRVLDYGSVRGIFYLAMELVDGESLESLVAREGPQPVGRVVSILLQVSRALAAAHEAGLIHRDVKPSNIMLEPGAGKEDLVTVVDFGLAKGTEPGDTELTGSQAIVGTPLYLAPERISGVDLVDARSDLYALGGVGYFLLTGQPPFEGEHFVEVCAKHLHDQVVPPSEIVKIDILPGLEEIVLACLEKEPSRRPPSAAVVQAKLEALERRLASRDQERLTKCAEARRNETGLLVTTVQTSPSSEAGQERLS
jgi:hypothetical protein